MWCRVIGIGQRVIFAITEHGEVVLVPHWRGTVGIQIGDIVAGDRELANHAPTDVYDAKFFVKSPHIIARKLTEEERKVRPDTRQRIEAGNPVAWKQEQERRADVDGLREAHAVAGNS